MITPGKDRWLERYLPRHWKKKASCKRWGCSKRRVHWHWVFSMTGATAARMIQRIYVKKLIRTINVKNPLYKLFEKQEIA